MAPLMPRRRRLPLALRRLRRSSLALFVPRVLADHAHHPLATDNFAVAANLLNGRQYFHDSLLDPFSYSYLARKVIRHRVKSYGETSTVTLSPGRMRM